MKHDKTTSDHFVDANKKTVPSALPAVPCSTSFAEWLKEVRKSYGMSYDKLSEKSGVSKSYLWDLENGTRSNVTLTVAEQITDAFGLKLWGVLKELSS